MAEEENGEAHGAEGGVTIIKRVKKGGHAHHGGAWKVAYADFVTAMMAFFLLLWLLNSVTEEQLQGISDYFAPTALSSSTSGAGGMLGGQVVGEGAASSDSSSPAIPMSLPPPSIGQGGADVTDPNEAPGEDQVEPSEEDLAMAAAEAAAKREQEQFEEAAETLRQAMQSAPDLQELQESLLIDNTPEGLRIQIVDQDGKSMFPPGSAAMYPHTRKLLEIVGRIVSNLNKNLAISGHTDSAGFGAPGGYSNWELSADRALASRRVLVESGVEDGRINRVGGQAANDPLFPDNPNDPRNRRVSIILLRDPPPTAASAAPDEGPMPSILE
ncbi:flagellar motor protein MotB [Roseospirillum parvum]|uniref:Chemotaxis protein MotB n=1 Tax=Roseospirillum parvum TaxID=83401 RepID=A0A1G7XZK3_9PROT|nr:flagellar motor protein MotB [Roseospirillum parvum]SDG89662.1 chemotaxis protein MotB [Roseospirillum parvum]